MLCSRSSVVVYCLTLYCSVNFGFLGHLSSNYTVKSSSLNDLYWQSNVEIKSPLDYQYCRLLPSTATTDAGIAFDTLKNHSLWQVLNSCLALHHIQNPQDQHHPVTLSRLATLPVGALIKAANDFAMVNVVFKSNGLTITDEAVGDGSFFNNRSLIADIADTGKINILVTDRIVIKNYSSNTLNLGLIFKHDQLLPAHARPPVVPNYQDYKYFVEASSGADFGQLIMQWPMFFYGFKFQQGSLTIKLPSDFWPEQDAQVDTWLRDLQNDKIKAKLEDLDFLFVQQVTNTIHFTPDLSAVTANYRRLLLHNLIMEPQDTALASFANQVAADKLKLSFDQALLRLKQCCGQSSTAIQVDANTLLGTHKTQLLYTSIMPTYIKLNGIWLNYDMFEFTAPAYDPSLSIFDAIQPVFIGCGLLLTQNQLLFEHDIFHNTTLQDPAAAGAVISWIPFGHYLQVGELHPDKVKTTAEDQWHQDWLLFNYKSSEPSSNTLLKLDYSTHRKTNPQQPAIKLSLRGLLVFPRVLDVHNPAIDTRGQKTPYVNLQYEQLGRIYGDIKITTPAFSKPMILQGLMHGNFLLHTTNTHVLDIHTTRFWRYSGAFNWLTNSSNALSYRLPNVAIPKQNSPVIRWRLGSGASLWFDNASFHTNNRSQYSSGVARKKPFGMLYFFNDQYDQKNVSSVHFAGKKNTINYDLHLNNVHFWLHQDSALSMKGTRYGHIFATGNTRINLSLAADASLDLGNISLRDDSALNIFFSAKAQEHQHSNNILLAVGNIRLVVEESNLLKRISHIQYLSADDLRKLRFVNTDLNSADNVFHDSILAHNKQLKVVVKNTSDHLSRNLLFALRVVNGKGKAKYIPLLKVINAQSQPRNSDISWLKGYKYTVKSSDYKMWRDKDLLPHLAKSSEFWQTTQDNNYKYLSAQDDRDDIHNINDGIHKTRAQKRVFMPRNANDVTWARNKLQTAASAHDHINIVSLSLNDKMHFQQKFWYPDILYLRSNMLWSYLFWPQDWVRVGALPDSLKKKIKADIRDIVKADPHTFSGNRLWLQPTEVDKTSDIFLDDLSTVTPQAAHRILNWLHNIREYAGVSALQKYLLPQQELNSTAKIYTFMALASQDIMYYTLDAQKIVHNLVHDQKQDLQDRFTKLAPAWLMNWVNNHNPDHSQNSDFWLSDIFLKVSQEPQRIFTDHDAQVMFLQFQSVGQNGNANGRQLYVNLPLASDVRRVTVGWDAPHNAKSVVTYTWPDFWNKLLHNSVLVLYRHLVYYMELLNHKDQRQNAPTENFTQDVAKVLAALDKYSSAEFTYLANEFLSYLFPQKMHFLQRELGEHYQLIFGHQEPATPIVDGQSAGSVSESTKNSKKPAPDHSTPVKGENPVKEPATQDKTVDAPVKEPVTQDKTVDAPVKEPATQDKTAGTETQTENRVEVIDDTNVVNSQQHLLSSDDDTQSADTRDLPNINALKQNIYNRIYTQISKVQLYNVYLMQNLQNFALNYYIADYLWLKYKKNSNFGLNLFKISTTNVNWFKVNVFNTKSLGMSVFGEYNLSLDDSWDISTKIIWSSVNITHNLKFFNLQTQEQDRQFDTYDHDDTSRSKIYNFAINVIGEYHHSPQSKQLAFLLLDHSNINQLMKNYDVDLYSTSSNLFLGGLYEQQLPWSYTIPIRFMAGGYVQINYLNYDHDLQARRYRPGSMTLSTVHLLAGFGVHKSFYFQKYQLLWQAQTRLRWKPDFLLWDNIKSDSTHVFQLYDYMLQNDDLFVNLSTSLYMHFTRNTSGKLSLVFDFGRHTNNAGLSLSLQIRI